eukprot:scaffold5797_cov115-Isochrysis_galbana.AAC.2
MLERGGRREKENDRVKAGEARQSAGGRLCPVERGEGERGEGGGRRMTGRIRKTKGKVHSAVLVIRLVAVNLWRHEAVGPGLARHHHLVGIGLRRGPWPQLGQPKISHLLGPTCGPGRVMRNLEHGPSLRDSPHLNTTRVVEQQVLRFQVPVHDGRLARVEVVHALRQLHGISDGTLPVQGWLVIGDGARLEDIQQRARHELGDHYLSTRSGALLGGTCGGRCGPGAQLASVAFGSKPGSERLRPNACGRGVHARWCGMPSQ